MRSLVHSFALAVVLAVLFGACNSAGIIDGSTAEPITSPTEATEEATGEATESAEQTPEATAVETADDATVDGVDIGLFLDGALAEQPTVEDCTLSDGAETTCYEITIAGFPASHDVGPFCPQTITDGADAGGIWFDGNDVYDLSGDFFVDLPNIYGDDAWQMYDADGNILVTETAEEFDAAARPDVDPSLQNHCVEGRLEWLDNGEPITTTVMIPTVPVPAAGSAASRGNLGVTLDGVVIAASAPVDAILGAYTIAAFDDCGAHFNPNDGYHMHAAVGCSEVGDADEDDAPMFGYAMDGYPVHSALDADHVADAGLDECGGHTTAAGGYHYHANSAEQNQVITCFVGQIVAGEGNAGAGGGRPDGPPPDGERPGQD